MLGNFFNEFKESYISLYVNSNIRPHPKENKVSPENITNKIEVQIGSRGEGKIEILSGLSEGDVIVAEGLKKVYPRAKINPIKEGEEKSETNWKKKEDKN